MAYVINSIINKFNDAVKEKICYSRLIPQFRLHAV